MRTVEGIEIFNICDLLPLETGASYEAECDAVMQWCADNDAAYYAADREDFSLFEAVRTAQAENKFRVVVEDLS